MRINIEDGALRDIRFAKLAAAGLPQPDPIRVGVAIMLPVWEYCTRQNVYVITDADLDLLLGAPNAAAAIIAAGLAERVEDGVRIKGTRGRVEWYEKNLENAIKGGEENRKRIAEGRPPKSRAATQAAIPPASHSDPASRLPMREEPSSLLCSALLSEKKRKKGSDTYPELDCSGDAAILADLRTKAPA